MATELKKAKPMFWSSADEAMLQALMARKAKFNEERIQRVETWLQENSSLRSTDIGEVAAAIVSKPGLKELL